MERENVPELNKDSIVHIKEIFRVFINPERAWYKNIGALYPERKKVYELRNGLIIKSRKQFIKSTYKCKGVIGYDTETYEGKCKLLCRYDSDNKFDSLNEKNDFPTFKQCLDFLCYWIDKPNIYRFFFNIDFDVSAILKLWSSKINVLKKRILRKIDYLSKGIPIIYKGYKIHWIKGRMFVINKIKRKRRVVFTDLYMFLDSGLNEASQKYLNAEKDNIDGNLLNTSLDYWNDNLDSIIEYCIKDCKLTMQIGQLLIDSVKKDVSLPKTLVSVASLTKQYFRLNSFIPSISYVPQKILQIGYDSYFGGRFDTLKRGTFNNTYLYDIVSQYPSYIKELYQLRNGLWFKTLEIPKEPCFAFFKVELNIPSDVIIPSIPMKDKGINIFPCGYINRWMTWFDVDLMRDYIIKVHKGYIFEKSPYNKKPFEKGIDYLFKKKAEVKGKSDIDYNIFKKTMNALGGCFIEAHLKQTLEKPEYLNIIKTELHAGIMFNSVYASQILAFGRWSVLKKIPIKEHKYVIAIHTDSIITDKSMDKYLTFSKKLGSINEPHWNLEKEGKGLSLTTGMYQIDDMVKTRGIPKKYIGTWFDFCRKYSNKEKVKFKIPHMKKIREAFVQDKCLEKVNTIVDYKRHVHCSYNNKRSWFKDFKNFKDVLTSNHSSLPHILYKNDTEFYMNEKCSQYRWNNAKPMYKERLDFKGKSIKLKLNRKTGLYMKKPNKKRIIKNPNRVKATKEVYQKENNEFRLVNLMETLDKKGYYNYNIDSLRETMNDLRKSENLDIIEVFIRDNLNLKGINVQTGNDQDLLIIDDQKQYIQYKIDYSEYYREKEKNKD